LVDLSFELTRVQDFGRNPSVLIEGSTSTDGSEGSEGTDGEGSEGGDGGEGGWSSSKNGGSGSSGYLLYYIIGSVAVAVAAIGVGCIIVYRVQAKRKLEESKVFARINQVNLP
jgi:hypothetical protein